MPEDERPPRAADLRPDDATASSWLALLESGALEIEGRMPWSSNATFLVRVGDSDEEHRAVYKPEAGERPLRDYPIGLYRREVAAYVLSEAMGLRVVPETIVRNEAPHGVGSLQRFIDCDYSEHYFTLIERPEHHAALRRIAGFDLVANSGDRKGGHLLLDPSGWIYGIDNGLCCHTDEKLRTVMWDFIGEQVPAEVLVGCEAILSYFPEPLGALLEPEECVALLERAEAVLEDPTFPAPILEHRAYPWPPI
jgi:uncharacterized repeat protein (TIGR03843 family)